MNFGHKRRRSESLVGAGRLGVGGLALAMLVSVATLEPAWARRARAVDTDRREMLYVVSAHADDELAGWTMMMDRPDTYQVVVTVTQGEGTISCETLEEAVPPPTGTSAGGVTVEGVRRHDVPLLAWVPERGWTGPYRYQGPEAPPGAGQSDKGERHPLGNPWQGKGTQACRDSRTASWHWFLDAASELDNGLPSFDIADDPEVDDDYVGEFCDQPRPDDGILGQSSAFVLCAKVWRNADGARVAFNAPNPIWGSDPEEFERTRQLTIRAVELLRESRSRWGLPTLPEAGVYANAYHYEGGHPECDPYPHPQHNAVQEAIYHHDFGAGPQYGVAACLADPRLEDAELEVRPWDSRLADFQLVDPLTGQRIGPYNVNYGWLFDEYNYDESSPFFWRRFG